MAFAAIGARGAEPDAALPPALQAAKTRKEIDQLDGKIEKLKFENGRIGRWVAPIAVPTTIAILGLGASLLATFLTIRSGRAQTLRQIRAAQKRTLQQIRAEREKTLQQIRAEVDHATHEKRLDCYAELTKAMSPLALFFPKDPKLDRFRCLQIGSAMSSWYFTTAGLLLSAEARDDYFRLARAVTKAFLRTPYLRRIKTSMPNRSTTRRWTSTAIRSIFL
jgi:hypothetical protein